MTAHTRTPARPGLPTDKLVLADGMRLRLRDIDSRDRDGFAAFFYRLSPASRLSRFLSPKRELTPRELDYFTDVDQFHHVAIAAVQESDGSIVAISRYVAHPDGPTGRAEVAMEVADELQAKGIGAALAHRTVQRARTNGFNGLTATISWDNQSAQRLLQRLRFKGRASQGTIEYELELT